MSFDHSKACMLTNITPKPAVTSISTVVLKRSRRYPQFTAIAMVPLLLISTKVMIAIRMSGMSWPPMLSENTWLGLGHGTVVEMRTFMYDVRKQLKMNVSESRKIHIIALPHGTGKACLSADRSDTTPGRPEAGIVSSAAGVSTGGDMTWDMVD